MLSLVAMTMCYLATAIAHAENEEYAPVLPFPLSSQNYHPSTPPHPPTTPVFHIPNPHLSPQPLHFLVSCSSFRVSIVESIPLGMSLAHNTSIADALLEMIHDARYDVSVAAFYMDLTSGNKSEGGQPGQDVFDGLVAAVQRNVSVKLVINGATDLFPNTDAFELARQGVQVRFLNFSQIFAPKPGGVLHTKLYTKDVSVEALNDESTTPAFLIASANCDWKSFTQVKEIGAYGVGGDETVKEVQKVFETYWEIGAKNATPGKWPSELDAKYNWDDPIKAHVNGSDESKVVVSQSPPKFEPPNWQDDLQTFLKVIANAEKTVDLEVMDYIPAMWYADPQTYWPVLDDALRTAAFAGKRVRFNIGYWNHTDPAAVMFAQSLNAFPNITVKLFRVPPYNPSIPFTRVNHAKWAVTDKHAYFTTSNWSEDYYVDTAGASIVFDDKNVVATAQGIFDRDWTSQYTQDLPYPPNPIPPTS